MKKIISLFHILGILVFLWSTSAQAFMLSFAPSSQDVELGNTASADLVISGLGDMAPDSLGAFDLDVIFDPTLLAFNSVTFGDQLDLFGLGSIAAVDSGVSGVVNLFELSLDLATDLDTLQLPTFSLATLTFDTLALGSSTLGISNAVLSDAWGFELFANVVDGAITTTIPVPAAAWLFGSSLIGLIGLAKRKKA